ncbi:hypothetical protein [Actinomadura nitritigenes]|uniref:hypothetical protein n=1 Tax=Actinomadura nitritigenes TaxID=134602 RepID=UPI003D90FA1A
MALSWIDPSGEGEADVSVLGQQRRQGGQRRRLRLTLSSGMGTKRGTEETGFVRSIDLAKDRFYREILLVLKPDTTQ